MTRELDYSDQAFDMLDELDRRGDEALLRAINRILDLIEDGDGSVRRGPYDLANVDAGSGKGWIPTATVRGTTWAVVWSIVDEQWAKIHAIIPSDSF